MKKALFFAVTIISLFAALAQARIWTDVKGNQIDGEYIGVSSNDTSKIRIKTRSGRVLSVSVNSLSQADQNYIRSVQNVGIVQNNAFTSEENAKPASKNNVYQSQKINEPDSSSNPDNAVVVVEGIGDTMADARKDAIRNAVEQTLWSLADAQTRAQNDELVEQILSSSSAYIEKYEVLSAKKENGLVTVKLRAAVPKTPLRKKFKHSSEGLTFAVDGANLAGMASSKADSEKSGAMSLANFLKNEEFPYSLLDTKVIGQPKIAHKGGEVIYTITLEASVNRTRYFDFVKRLKPIIDKYAIEKKSFAIETKSANNNIITNLQYKAPEYNYKGVNLPFYLCTNVTGNYHSLKFDAYELPQKFSVPLGYYKRVAPVIVVMLLNGNNEVIASQRAILGFKSIDTEPFNAMPSMYRRIDLENPYKVEESTLLNLKYDYYGIGWCVIAPYRHKDNYEIILSSVFDISIVLSPDELSKVRSAKIVVSVNNPEMDNAFERMEEEIDQVPTN